MLADVQEHTPSACGCFVVKKLNVLKSQHEGHIDGMLVFPALFIRGWRIKPKSTAKSRFLPYKTAVQEWNKAWKYFKKQHVDFFFLPEMEFLRNSHCDASPLTSTWCIEEEELGGTKSFALLPSAVAQTLLQEWGLCSSQCSFSPHRSLRVLLPDQFLCRF